MGVIWFSVVVVAVAGGVGVDVVVGFVYQYRVYAVLLCGFIASICMQISNARNSTGPSGRQAGSRAGSRRARARNVLSSLDFWPRQSAKQAASALTTLGCHKQARETKVGADAAGESR